MIAEILLQRLEAVRPTGRDRWIARCPAHQDRHPSLSIRELDDGRVLAHCHAGCAIDAVLVALGLDMTALYPARPIEHTTRERQPWSAYDVLAAIVTEMDIIAIIAGDMHEHRQIADKDYQRLRLARDRIRRAADVVGVA